MDPTDMVRLTETRRQFLSAVLLKNQIHVPCTRVWTIERVCLHNKSLDRWIIPYIPV